MSTFVILSLLLDTMKVINYMYGNIGNCNCENMLVIIKIKVTRNGIF